MLKIYLKIPAAVCRQLEIIQQEILLANNLPFDLYIGDICEKKIDCNKRCFFQSLSEKAKQYGFSAIQEILN